MRRITIFRPGGWDRLVLEAQPEVRPGRGQVVVDVEACGVNFADCVTRMGLYASAKQEVGWPITPGFELCGRVSALGRDVTDLELGERVFGVTRFGAYASRVAVPREQLFRPPSGWDATACATFPAVFLTAWYALFELGAAREGKIALVHSAAGGVGGALCQLGRIAGLSTVGVVGAPHKVEAARSFGASQVIDRSREPLWERARELAPDGYDLVLDASGPATLREGWRQLAPAGRLVTYGFHTMLSRGRGRPNPLRLAWGWTRLPRFNPLRMTRENKSLMAFNLSFLFHRTDLLAGAMTQLIQWAEAGWIRPAPVLTFPLAKAAEAHRALESGRTVGKLALLP